MIKLINFVDGKNYKYYLCKDIENYDFHYQKLNYCYQGVYSEFYDFILDCFIPIEVERQLEDCKKIISSLHNIIQYDNSNKATDILKKIEEISQLYTIEEINQYLNDKLINQSLSIDLEDTLENYACIYNNKISFISVNTLYCNLQDIVFSIIDYFYELQVSDIVIYEIFYNSFKGEKHEDNI